MLIAQKTQESLRRVVDDFIKAQKAGDVRKNIHPQFILYLFNRLLQMTEDEQLLKLYASPQDLIMEMTNFYFYGILGRHE